MQALCHGTYKQLLLVEAISPWVRDHNFVKIAYAASLTLYMSSRSSESWTKLKHLHATLSIKRNEQSMARKEATISMSKNGRRHKQTTIVRTCAVHLLGTSSNPRHVVDDRLAYPNNSQCMIRYSMMHTVPVLIIQPPERQPYYEYIYIAWLRAIISDPICNSDHKTYWNLVTAFAFHITVMHTSLCRHK